MRHCFPDDLGCLEEMKPSCVTVESFPSVPKLSPEIETDITAQCFLRAFASGRNFGLDGTQTPAHVRLVDAQFRRNPPLGVASAVQFPDPPFSLRQPGRLNCDIPQLPDRHRPRNYQSTGYPVFVQAADDGLAAERVAFIHVRNLLAMVSEELAGLLFFASAQIDVPFHPHGARALGWRDFVLPLPVVEPDRGVWTELSVVLAPGGGLLLAVYGVKHAVQQGPVQLEL
jgi:hypothetical protein